MSTVTGLCRILFRLARGVSNITGLCGLPKDRLADDVDLFRLATDFLVFRKETGLSIGVFERRLSVLFNTGVWSKARSSLDEIEFLVDDFNLWGTLSFKLGVWLSLECEEAISAKCLKSALGLGVRSALGLRSSDEDISLH